jgi:hypothetical protein
MNDEELEQRLRAQIHDLVRPPYGAPETLRQRVGSLDMMEPIGHGSHLGVPSVLRKPRILAAAAVVAALIGSAMLFRQSSPPHPGNSVHLPAQFEMFGRIDATSAWVEDGADIFITRDDGATWTKGTVPGGTSPKTGSLQQNTGQTIEWPTSEPTPEPTPEPAATPNGGPGFDHLYPVFVDADHGWLLSWTVANAVSGGSDCRPGDWTLTVWRTSDGAQSWQAAALPGTYGSYGTIQFTDKQHGWVTVERMGYATCVVQSGGTEASVGPAATSVTDLQAATPPPSPTQAPVPEDATTVLSTTDGGATWTRTSTLNTYAVLDFAGNDEAWGFGASSLSSVDLVLHSTDGARTWTKAQLPLPPGAAIAGIGQVPVRDGELVNLHIVAYQSQPDYQSSTGDQGARIAPDSGPNYVILTYVSDDGGETWKLEATRAVPGSSPNLMSGSYASIVQTPPDQPIAVIEPGFVGGGGDGTTFTYASGTPDSLQASFDGGVSWTSYATKGLPGNVNMAQWASPDDVWVASGESQKGGLGYATYVYTTRDGGATWTPLGSAPSWPVPTQPTLPPFMIGPDGSYGAVATPQAQPQPVLTQTSVVSMGRADANVGWVEAIGSTGSVELRITADGGSTWSEPRPVPAMGEAQFVDANKGWLIDSSTTVPLGSSRSLSLFSTTDGGRSWVPSTVDMGSVPDSAGGSSGGWSSFQGIHFRDATHGELYSTIAYSTGSDVQDPTKWDTVCTQASTADGGATWSPPRDGPCAVQLTFDSSSQGYAQNWQDGPTVYVTSDGGQTWVTGALPPAKSPGPGSVAGRLLLLEHRADGTLRALVDTGGSLAVDVSGDGGKTWTDSGYAVGSNGLASSGYRVVRLAEGSWLALRESVDPTQSADAWLTGDAGLSWIPLAVPGLDPVGDVSFVSATDGWAVGQESSCQASGDGSQTCQASVYILATWDGGQTWRTILTP